MCSLSGGQKFYFTVSGIITPIGVMIPHHTYRCDDTRDYIIQFSPADDEHMCSKHVEARNKLIIKFSASSWFILINKENISFLWLVFLQTFILISSFVFANTFFRFSLPQ